MAAAGDAEQGRKSHGRFGGERRLTIDGDGEPPLGIGVTVLLREAGRWRLAVDTAVRPLSVYIAELAMACRIRDLLVEHPPIEELVGRLYREGAPCAG